MFSCECGQRSAGQNFIKMQNPGSLRKRRSRNLSKVNGLGWPNKQRNGNFPADKRSNNRVTSATFNEVETSASPNEMQNIEIEGDNPYLLTKGVLWRLERILDLGRIVFHFPWSWDEIKGPDGVVNFVIRKWNPTLHRIWTLGSLVILFLSISLTMFHIWLLIQSYTEAAGSFRKTFVHFDSICWNIHSVMLNILLLWYKEPMRNYANTLLSFNRKLVAEYGVIMTKEKSKGKLFMNVTVPVFLSQVVLHVLRYCNTYNTPEYLTSYWSQFSGGEAPNFLVVLGALQDFLTGGQLVSGTLFLGWLTVSHSTSLEFWIEEAQSDAEKGINGLGKAERAMELYRMVQVMSQLYNTTVGKVAVPMCAIMNWSAAISCGYVAIRSMNQLFLDEFPSSIFYPFGITLTLCSAFAQFQMAAVLHDMSASFLDSWSYTQDEYLRRFLVSCRIIRVTAGAVASVTRGSLVTFFRTVSGHIIDCVITFP